MFRLLLWARSMSRLWPCAQRPSKQKEAEAASPRGREHGGDIGGGGPGSRSSSPLFQFSNLNIWKHFLPLPLYPLSSPLPSQRFPSPKNVPLPTSPPALSRLPWFVKNLQHRLFLPGKAPRKRRPCGWTQRSTREPGPVGGRARISFFAPWLKTTPDTVSFS